MTDTRAQLVLMRRQTLPNTIKARLYVSNAAVMLLGIHVRLADRPACQQRTLRYEVVASSCSSFSMIDSGWLLATA